jgi:hypothetical protein
MLYHAFAAAGRAASFCFDTFHLNGAANGLLICVNIHNFCRVIMTID